MYKIQGVVFLITTFCEFFEYFGYKSFRYVFSKYFLRILSFTVKNCNSINSTLSMFAFHGLCFGLYIKSNHQTKNHRNLSTVFFF